MTVQQPDKHLSHGKRNERNTYLYFIVAFHFSEPAKAAHMKEALFYSFGFHCIGCGVKNNKEFLYL